MSRDNIQDSTCLVGFALNSILIDERLGYTTKVSSQTPRLAIIPPFTPVLRNALIKNNYEVSLIRLQKWKIANYIFKSKFFG